MLVVKDVMEPHNGGIDRLPVPWNPGLKALLVADFHSETLINNIRTLVRDLTSLPF